MGTKPRTGIVEVAPMRECLQRPGRSFRRFAAALVLGLGALFLSPQADAHHWHGGWGWGWGCCGWGWGGWWGPHYSISLGWPSYYGYPYSAYPYYAAPYYPPYAYPPAYSYAPSYAPSYNYAPPEAYQPQQQPLASNVPAPQTWYYCENPRGYYPQVKSCTIGWHQVLVQPSTSTGQPP